MTTPPPGHEQAKPIARLIQEWPDLRNVMKALQPDYVFVRRYLRTIPKRADGTTYRTDAYVNGLYVVDTHALRQGRHPPCSSTNSRKRSMTSWITAKNSSFVAAGTIWSGFAVAKAWVAACQT